MIPLLARPLPLLALIACAATAMTVYAYDPAQMGPPPESSGQYLVQIAGCADCHTDKDNQYMAGGLEFKLPGAAGLPGSLGTIFTPNLTPDPIYGIGKWTYEDFKTAIRDGVSPKGHRYFPAFPYRSYSKITDADLRKMWDYLRSIPAVPKQNRVDETMVPRPVLAGWNFFYFWNVIPKTATEWIRKGHGAMRPFSSQPADWNRGAYLAESLAHCTECHTPRNFLTNGLETEAWMSGGEVEGVHVPNITSDKKTGRGNWGEADWDRFLRVGINKNGDYIKNDNMREVVQNTAGLTEADRHALIKYLMSLPAIQRGEDAP